uniref:Uncharacterized protein n=1 Tax=Ditylenchus dipsaci TaxID=166011 RepID=A0A915CYH3_9BILA
MKFFILTAFFLVTISAALSLLHSSSSEEGEGQDAFGSVAKHFKSYFNVVRRQATGSTTQLSYGPNISTIYAHLAAVVGCDLRALDQPSCSYVEQRKDGSVIEVTRQESTKEGKIKLRDNQYNELNIKQLVKSMEIQATDAQGNSIYIVENANGKDVRV